MRVLVCGDRNWGKHEDFCARSGCVIGCNALRERSKLALRLDRLPFRDLVIIEGEARGADSLAREWAEQAGFTVLGFPAEWEKYGRRAGPIRNQQMLTEGKPELVIAFHRDIHHSKGTKGMVARATRAGIPVEIFS